MVTFLNIDDENEPKKHVRICESHFDPDDILRPTINDLGKGRIFKAKRIRKGAVLKHACTRLQRDNLCVSCVHG